MLTQYSHKADIILTEEWQHVYTHVAALKFKDDFSVPTVIPLLFETLFVQIYCLIIIIADAACKEFFLCKEIENYVFSVL